LKLSVQGVEDFDVNLGTVKRAVSWIQSPRGIFLLSKVVERLCQHGLCTIPDLNRTKKLLGPGREPQLELQTNLSVHRI